MAPDHGLRIAEPELGVIAAFLHLEAKTATLGEAAEDAQELVWLPNFSIGQNCPIINAGNRHKAFIVP